jgi:hypothetical protein
LEIPLHSQAEREIFGEVILQRLKLADNGRACFRNGALQAGFLMTRQPDRHDGGGVCFSRWWWWRSLFVMVVVFLLVFLLPVFAIGEEIEDDDNFSTSPETRPRNVLEMFSQLC